jgi:hypothetical protein
MALWLSWLLLQDVSSLDEAPPADVPEAIRKELSDSGLRVTRDEKPMLDLWFRKTIPSDKPKEELDYKFGAIKTGTLVGVARFHIETTDSRELAVKPGLYTLRYAVQPQDGDHLGAAPTRDFLLLCRTADESSADVVLAGELLKRSAKVNGTRHPATMWLAKPADGADKLPMVRHDEDAARHHLDCEAASTNGPLRFSILIAGKTSE